MCLKYLCDMISNQLTCQTTQRMPWQEPLISGQHKSANHSVETMASGYDKSVRVDCSLPHEGFSLLSTCINHQTNDRRFGLEMLRELFHPQKY